jgi:hypothetical protein
VLLVSHMASCLKDGRSISQRLLSIHTYMCFIVYVMGTIWSSCLLSGLAVCSSG